MRTLLSALILFVASVPVWSVAVGSGLQSAAMLVDRCHHYMSDPANSAGRVCTAYMQGFMAGARGSGWLYGGFTSRVGTSVSSWPMNTGLINNAHGISPRFCVADKFSMNELINQLIGYSTLRADLNSVSAVSLVKDMFTAKYPCRVLR